MKLPLNDPAKALAYFEQKLAFTLGPIEVQEFIDDGQDFNLIDVRDEEDYVEGHAPSAINLPEERWETFQGLFKDRMNIVYCYSQVCHLAARAAAFFASRGYPVMEMEGGFDAWEDHELDIETGLEPSSRNQSRAA